MGQNDTLWKVCKECVKQGWQRAEQSRGPGSHHPCCCAIDDVICVLLHYQAPPYTMYCNFLRANPSPYKEYTIENYQNEMITSILPDVLIKINNQLIWVASAYWMHEGHSSTYNAVTYDNIEKWSSYWIPTQLTRQ